jgi:hypothetical protein
MQQRIQQAVQKTPESSNTVFEWTNAKSIISQPADEILGIYEAFTQMKKLKTWNSEINVQQKNLAYKNYLRTKTI